MNLSDDDLRDLENMILKQPDIGELVQGTGGLRKARFSINNKGKSELENITEQQKQMFKQIISAILNEFKSRKGVK